MIDIKDDSVDLHRHVILCDHGLGREVHDLFLQVDAPCHTVNDRKLEVQARAPRREICAETLDDDRLCLMYDLDA